MNRVPWWVWVLALVVVLGSGGAAAVAYVMDDRSKRDKLRGTLRTAAEVAGVDPDLVDAIAKIESDYNPGAKNEKGPDAARGGSYGPTQISMKTALAHGPATPADLMAPDGGAAAYYTAAILAARPGGPPTNPDDAAAWWNAGRINFTDLPTTNSARTTYAPRLRAALAWVKANPPAENAA